MTEVTKAPLSTNAYLTSHHMQMWSTIPPWAPSLSPSSAGFDTNNLLYPISLKLSGFLNFKRRPNLQQEVVEDVELTCAVFINNYFIPPMLPVLYYYAQTPTVKEKQGGKSQPKLSYCRKKKQNHREPFLLSRTTNYLQVYTVHSFLGKPRIKEDPKPQKNASKRSRGWARACPGSADRTDRLPHLQLQLQQAIN